MVIDGDKSSKRLKMEYYESGLWSVPLFYGVKIIRYTIFSMAFLDINSRVDLENVDQEFIHIYRLGVMVT